MRCCICNKEGDIKKMIGLVKDSIFKQPPPRTFAPRAFVHVKCWQKVEILRMQERFSKLTGF